MKIFVHSRQTAVWERKRYFTRKAKPTSVTHAWGKMMETMFYKRTDCDNHENDFAVAVPGGFESYIASHLFIEEKKKRRWNIWMIFLCKKSVILHANSKHKQTCGFLGGKKDKQIPYCLCAHIWKFLANGKSNLMNSPCPLMFDFAGFIQKLNLLLCKIS